MRIEFNGVGLTEADAHRLGGVIGMMQEQMELPADALTEVIVTSAETFAEVVRRFDATGTYTNARGLLAVGKTYANRLPGQSTTSSIILREFCVVPLLEALDSPAQSIDEWTEPQQLAAYTMAHELGHCLDHWRRPADEADGTHRNEQGQRILGGAVADLCAYYYSMLLSELAACVFSAPYYTEKLRRDECRMNNDFVSRQLESLQLLTRDHSEDLHQIQSEAGGLFWFVLMQQAKQSAVRLNNRVLSEVSASSMWHIARASDAIANAITRAESAIVAAWNGYPVFPPGLLDTLTQSFHEMAGVHSFRFRGAGGRDGIWWNTLFQRVAFDRAQVARAEAGDLTFSG